MKRLIAAAVPLLLIILGISWYLLRDDAITIGIVAEHTSTTSTSNVDSYDGAELAFSEMNADGSNYVLRRIDLADMSDPHSLSAQLESEGIDIVVGPVTSGQFIPYKDVLADCGLPVFLNSVSTNLISDTQDNIFRLTDDISSHIKAIDTALSSPFNAEHVTIFFTTENRSYSEAFSSEALACFHRRGLDASMIEVGSSDDKEVQELLKQSYGGDIFLVVAGPGDAGIIAQLLSIVNPDTPFMFTAWSKDDRLIEYTSHLTNDIYLVASPPPVRTENYASYTAALETDYSKTANNFSTYGYEVAYFVDHVLSHTGSLNTDQIQNYIHSIQVYEGRFNDFIFDDTGDGGRGYALYAVSNDALQVVTPYLEEVSNDDN